MAKYRNIGTRNLAAGLCVRGIHRVSGVMVLVSVENLARLQIVREKGKLIRVRFYDNSIIYI